MDRFGIAIALGAALAAATPSAQAQIRTGGTLPNNGTIYQTPRTGSQPVQMPPDGMCRIWIDGLPAGRQPAPTDCGTAQRRDLPPNGRIIYGSQTQGTYGNGQYDPRRDPRNEQYDPRRDPRSAQYDPRLDPYDNGRTNGTYGRNDDRGKWERKQEKERQKQWKKENKGNKGHGNGDGHDDHDDDNDQQSQNGQHRGNGHQ